MRWSRHSEFRDLDAVSNWAFPRLVFASFVFLYPLAFLAISLQVQEEKMGSWIRRGSRHERGVQSLAEGCLGDNSSILNTPVCCVRHGARE